MRSGHCLPGHPPPSPTPLRTPIGHRPALRCLFWGPPSGRAPAADRDPEQDLLRRRTETRSRSPSRPRARCRPSPSPARGAAHHRGCRGLLRRRGGRGLLRRLLDPWWRPIVARLGGASNQTCRPVTPSPPPRPAETENPPTAGISVSADHDAPPPTAGKPIEDLAGVLVSGSSHQLRVAQPQPTTMSTPPNVGKPIVDYAVLGPSHHDQGAPSTGGWGGGWLRPY